MKAEELMIGDWVCYDGDENHECPVQIDGISKKEAGVEGDWYDVWEPIPLTPEILEKNGWSKENEGRLYVDSNNVMIAHVEKHFELTKSWQRHYNRLETIAINIRYLHELQHALKLCGIEKEIIL